MLEQLETYKVHPSSLGVFITEKTGKIADNVTADKKIIEIFIELTDSLKKTINSKYLTKGTLCEPEGLRMLQNTIYKKSQVFLVNAKEKSNDFLTGTADVIPPSDIIYDIKNAWDRFTFASASFTHGYKWQGKAYLYLYGKDHFRLFYCLNNMPERLLSDLYRKQKYEKDYGVTWDEIEYSSEYIEDCRQIKINNTYDHIPIEEKFKVWDLKLEEGDVELMQKVTIHVRERLVALWHQKQADIKYNKELMGLN